MNRTTLFALATVAALAATPVFAQQPQRGPDGPGAEAAVAFDRSALVDARIAALRAGLRLTPDQEPLFAPVEDALRAAAATREARHAERRERMGEMRERMGEGGMGRGGMGQGGMGQGGMGQGGMGDTREGMGAMREGMGRMGEGRMGDGPMAGDFMERLERRAARTAERADEIGAFAEAMRPLWDSLDEGQRAILPVLLRDTGAIGRGHDGDRRGGGYHGGGHHGRMHGRM